MVRAEDYIRKRFSNPVDFAIVDQLYLLRCSKPLSARELTSMLKRFYVCDNGHVSPEGGGRCSECGQRTKPLLHADQMYAERTVRKHLSHLKSSGVIQERVREASGCKGRPPAVYNLSEGFLKTLEDYLDVKEMRMSIMVGGLVIKERPKRGRAKPDATDIVHCPSCGNPTHRSDIVQLDGGRTICLTEYAQLARVKSGGCVRENGVWRMSVEGIPALTATGSTEDECKERFTERVVSYVREHKRAGMKPPIYPEEEP